MDRWRTVKFLQRFLPIRRWQVLLLRRHARSCPECRSSLAEVEEARKATLSQRALGPVKDFWPEFVKILKKDLPERESSPGIRRPWWLAFAGLSAAGLAVAVALLTSPPPDRVADLLVKVRIQSAKIYDRPAQAIIFQTQDVDRTFIWVEQIPK